MCLAIEQVWLDYGVTLEHIPGKEKELQNVYKRAIALFHSPALKQRLCEAMLREYMAQPRGAEASSVDARATAFAAVNLHLEIFLLHVHRLYLLV